MPPLESWGLPRYDHTLVLSGRKDLLGNINMRKLTGLLLILGLAGFRVLAAGAAAPATTTAAPAEPPTSWVDPDTGHRVIRLTREPGSDSFYFNYNGYTPDGEGGEAGQHVQAELSPRTEPQFYARPEVCRFPLEHVRAGLRLCGRSCESEDIAVNLEPKSAIDER